MQGGWDKKVVEVADLFSFELDGEKKGRKRQATECMRRTAKEKRRVRFHPGSPAVLIIEDSTLGRGKTAN